MKAIRNIMLASAMAFGVVAISASAFAAEPKKEEMKCDKDGKACKDGAECKAENCQKGQKK